MNASTGLISGTPVSLGWNQVGVTVSETGASTTQTFEWQVQETGLLFPGNQTSTEGATISLALQGALGSGGTLQYTVFGLPDGLSLNATTGVISGVLLPGTAADGPYALTAQVYDGVSIGIQMFNWTVNPYVSLTLLASQSNVEGNIVSLAVSATDVGSVSLSYSASGLPGGLSINPTTGLISGTVATGAALSGPALVLVTVDDGTYSGSETLTWSLTPATAPAAPVITSMVVQSNPAGDAVSLQVQASDSAGYSLSYAASGLPDGLWIDPTAGLIQGTVAENAVSSEPYNVTVTVSDGVGETTSQTLQWLVNPSPMTLTFNSLAFVQGTASGQIAVATITTPDQNSWSGEYTTMINWGDGISGPGTVTGQNGVYTITADHTYYEGGSATITLMVDKSDGNYGTNSVSIWVLRPMIGSELYSPMTLTGGFQQGGIAGTSHGYVVAELQDADPQATTGDFTVAIDPGDGGSDQTGVVTALGNGIWTVNLPYTYTATGTYTAVVYVTDNYSNEVSASSTVVVGQVYAGEAATITLPGFTSANSSATASDYTATITWGDGDSSSGTVTGSGGVFTVQGTHTYTQDSLSQSGGAYTVNVTVNGPDGPMVMPPETVAVVPPGLTVQVQNLVVQSSGIVSSQAVAIITDPNVTDSASGFTVMIGWGDGTTSTGTVSGSNGLFQVTGGHSYATSGNYIVQVIVSHVWSTATSLISTVSTAIAVPLPPKLFDALDEELEDMEDDLATILSDFKNAVADAKEQLAAVIKIREQIQAAYNQKPPNITKITNLINDYENAQLKYQMLLGEVQDLFNAFVNEFDQAIELYEILYGDEADFAADYAEDAIGMLASISELWNGLHNETTAIGRLGTETGNQTLSGFYRAFLALSFNGLSLDAFIFAVNVNELANP